MTPPPASKQSSFFRNPTRCHAKWLPSANLMVGQGPELVCKCRHSIPRWCTVWRSPARTGHASWASWWRLPAEMAWWQYTMLTSRSSLLSTGSSARWAGKLFHAPLRQLAGNRDNRTWRLDTDMSVHTLCARPSISKIHSYEGSYRNLQQPCCPERCGLWLEPCREC